MNSLGLKTSFSASIILILNSRYAFSASSKSLSSTAILLKSVSLGILLLWSLKLRTHYSIKILALSLSAFIKLYSTISSFTVVYTSSSEDSSPLSSSSSKSCIFFSYYSEEVTWASSACCLSFFIRIIFLRMATWPSAFSSSFSMNLTSVKILSRIPYSTRALCLL